jgi:hypothetical protein
VLRRQRDRQSAHIARVMNKRASSTREIVLLEDGDAVSGLGQSRGGGDTTHTGAYSPHLGQHAEHAATVEHRPMMMAVWSR